MSSQKTAALTGVLYYLLEEQHGLKEAGRDRIPGAGAGPWALNGRNLSAGQQRLLQGRHFSAPAGLRSAPQGIRAGDPSSRRVRKSFDSRARLLCRRAEKGTAGGRDNRKARS